MRKRILVTLTFIMLVVCGLYLGNTPFGSSIVELGKKNETDHGTAAISNDGTLEEELYGVELIVKGEVEELQKSFIRNSGVFSKAGELAYDVTPATIKIEKVLYGDLPVSKKITLLQHGTTEDKKIRPHFVLPGDEVVLLLVKTTDGFYWSYSFNEGIWKINNGTVDSKTEKEMYKAFKKADTDLFTDKIVNAAKNKKKRIDTRYEE